MASQGKKQSETKVTRIKATDEVSAKKTVAKSTKEVAKKATVKTPGTSKLPKGFRAVLKPFIMLGGYFKGAWVELREVRWPTRKSTWGLTVAVLLFSAFFAVLILLLDALFKLLFEFILK